VDTERLIRQINAARMEHIIWIQRAESLVSGIEISAEYQPVSAKDSTFGRWYLGHGKVLQDKMAFVQCWAPHEAFHKLYARIYRLITEEMATSTIGRILGKHKKQKTEAQEKAEALLPELYEYYQYINALLEGIALELRQPKAEVKPKPAVKQALTDVTAENFLEDSVDDSIEKSVEEELPWPSPPEPVKPVYHQVKRVADMMDDLDKDLEKWLKE